MDNCKDHAVADHLKQLAMKATVNESTAVNAQGQVTSHILSLYGWNCLHFSSMYHSWQNPNVKHVVASMQQHVRQAGQRAAVAATGGNKRRLVLRHCSMHHKCLLNTIWHRLQTFRMHPTIKGNHRKVQQHLG